MHADDDRLSRELRELPRVEALEGFTTRVLARLDEARLDEARLDEARLDEAESAPPARRRWGRPMLAWSLASAAVFVSILYLRTPAQEPATPTLAETGQPEPTEAGTTGSAAPGTRRPRPVIGVPASATAGRTALRAEHQRLQRELEELRRLRAQRPVLVLGGDEEVDVVIDLETFVVQGAPAAAEVALEPGPPPAAVEERR